MGKRTKRHKRLVSLLTVFAICLSLLPASIAFAETQTFVRVTDEADLTDGQYVLAVSYGGESLAMKTTADGNNWLGAESVNISNGEISADAADNYIWNLIFQDDGTAFLQTAGGQYAARSGTSNVLFTQAGEYAWRYRYDSNAGTLAFHEDKDLSGDTYIIAYNGISPNFKFRSYKYSTPTGNPSSYAYEFTLFKLDDSGGPVDPEPGGSGVVISQIYGGGGNSGAAYTHDFIELYNTTGRDVSLAGWSVQYWSATGTNAQITPLSGSIPANGYYLIQEAAGAGGTTSLPTPDAIGEIPMSASAGKIALADTVSAIPGGPIDLANPNIIDFVGYGTNADTYEGSGPAPAPSNVLAIARDPGGTDTDDNAADFTTQEPNPRNSGNEATVFPPEASIASGSRVSSGTRIQFTSATEGADFYYNREAADAAADAWMIVPDEGIEVAGEPEDVVTLYVKAAKNSFESTVVPFTYTVREATASYLIDELLGGVADAINIQDALDAGNESMTVVGQLAYRFGSSAVFQDIIDGEIIALQTFGDAYDGYEIGDVLKVSGTKTLYYAVPQLTNLTYELLIPATDENLAFIGPQTFDSIAEIRSNIGGLLSEVVLVENVTLGSANGNYIPVTDSHGNSLDIYQAGDFPPGFSIPSEEIDLLAVVSTYNASPQLRTGNATENSGNPVYIVKNDNTAPVITMPGSYLSAQVGEDYALSVSIVDNVAVTSATVEYTIEGGDSYGPDPLTRNSITGYYEYTIPGTLFTDQTSSLTYTIKASDAAGNESEETSGVILILNNPVVKEVVPAGGSATYDDKRPEISLTFENGGENPAVTLTLIHQDGTAVVSDASMVVTGSGQAKKATFTAYDADLADGRYTASAEIVRESSAEPYEYSWNFVVGEPLYRAYFGQLHAHTAEYSDGAGTLLQALNYINNIPESDNVEFVSFTDHSNYFDTTSAANPAEALGDRSLMTAASRATWEGYLDKMRSFNEEDNGILAIPGFEMTWSGGPGHINTFNSDGLVSRNDTALNNKTNDAGMRLYYETLKDPANAGTISQFNHPGTTFGTFADFAYWDPGIDRMITLIEVGNGAGAVGSSAYFPSYEYYTQALDKGWHLAPTNNQDNHSANWGNANTARSVIYADEFSEEGLLEGMRNMTMYSSEDKNLEIMYTVNGQIMGSVIEQVPDKLEIEAVINDPDGEAIGTVEIIVNGGRTLIQETVSTSSATLKFEIEDPAYSYYFLRVIQPDKDIAVTAPVWVGEVVKIGITGMTTETIMPVKGEEMNFELALYNYEDAPMEIEKLEFSITHLNQTTVLESRTDLTAIPAMTDRTTYGLSYMPDKLGFITLTARVEATLNGTPYDFETSMEFEVLDPDSVIPIAIDGGHSNFYVTGNYPDSDTGLIEMAARSGIRVVRLNRGELTYENLQDKALLVLTVPFDSFGTAITQYLYTDAEIEAIRLYAENGGNIVLCSKSDRGDPAAQNEWASVISNEILEAIGAEARVAQGLVIDEVRKSNELYRITLGGDSDADKLCYNYSAMNTDELAAMFLKDVEETTNNTFSAYNSAPILANGTTSLVSGFPETTWGTYFNDLSNNTTLRPDARTVTEKGDTHLLTAERLTGGGFLIVSGVTFFSTFEVQVELDYAGQLQNTNYQIVQNILDQVRPEPVIAPIAEVQAAEEGLPFTIEGIATSNASGYDRDTAFFDCIYIQDGTAGINVFPVDGSIQEGQTVRVSGYTSSFEGERQLDITGYTVTVVDAGIKLVEPREVTTKEAAEATWLGSLIKITGTVIEIGEDDAGNIETIMIQDDSGVAARIYINGYITSEKVIEGLEVGAVFTATGLSSIDPSGPRIRIRDRDDIVKTGDPGPQPEGNNVVRYTADEGAIARSEGSTAPFDVTSTLSIENPDNINMVVMYFEYDAGQFEYVTHQDLHDRMQIFDITAEDGRGRLITSIAGGGRLTAEGEVELLRLQFRSLAGAMPNEAVVKATTVEVWDASDMVDFQVAENTARTAVYYVSSIYDVNADGVVSWGDLAYAMDHYMKSAEDYDDFYDGVDGLWRMDLDGDGVITMNDYLILMAGIEEALGLQFTMIVLDVLAGE